MATNTTVTIYVIRVSDGLDRTTISLSDIKVKK